MVRELEYLDQAIVEAEAAARWYPERSPTAAARFSAELDEAVAAILERPEAWPWGNAGTRRYLLRRFPFSVVYRVEDLATAEFGHLVPPNMPLALFSTATSIAVGRATAAA